MQKWGWLDKIRIEIFLNEFLKSLLFRYWKRVYRANWRLSTLFQIDFEVIRTMRRENFSFSFAENVGKFVILGRDIGEIRSFCKFCRVGLNVRRMKIEFKIVGVQKFWCMQECCSTNDSNVRSLRVRHGGLRCRYGNCRVWWLQRGVQNRWRCQWYFGHDARRSKIFLQRWMEVYRPIYPVNQWIVSGKPVVSKDQRAGRIKQSDIEVQIHTITSGKYYGQVGNFGDGAVWWTIKQVESNWRSCRCLQVVSIHKFRVYKAVSRPGVDESSEQDFIKVILTKDQGRSKENKKWMRIRKSGCVELNWTRCCTGKFNVTLSLCGVLGIALYFSEGFSEAAARVSAVAEVPRPLREIVVCFLEQESNL